MKTPFKSRSKMITIMRASLLEFGFFSSVMFYAALKLFGCKIKLKVWMTNLLSFFSFIRTAFD
jgi:hypothetical protein